jgi:hypothetical protein
MSLLVVKSIARLQKLVFKFVLLYGAEDAGPDRLGFLSDRHF